MSENTDKGGGTEPAMNGPRKRKGSIGRDTPDPSTNNIEKERDYTDDQLVLVKRCGIFLTV